MSLISPWTISQGNQNLTFRLQDHPRGYEGTWFLMFALQSREWGQAKINTK